MSSWFQQIVELPPASRGCHLITAHVTAALPEIRQIRVGVLHAFIQHTSASLTINENADPDVRVDLEAAINGESPLQNLALLPYDAIVVRVDTSPGEIIVSELHSKPLLVIAKAGSMRAQANVGAAYLGGLTRGAEAKVRVRDR